jgi:phenylpyruvate tautomerase PptA (4-oxalocrotonate tautomerase family)
MPFVRVSAPQHLDDQQLKHISDSIHASLVATFNVPEQDRFQVLIRHKPADLVCAASYLDVPHTTSVVFVQITCNEGRTVEMKKALFAKLAASIASGGAILPSDVIVSLVETKRENWSFGNGLAQYAT